MNEDYRIYRAPDDEIPAEDKARFDGYAKGFEDAKKVLEDSMARLKESGAIVTEDETDPLAGLPPDLARVLRDPSIIVPQDQAVFEQIAKWANAQSDTPSAMPSVFIDGHRFGHGVRPQMTGAEICNLAIPPISADYDLFEERPGQQDRLVIHSDVIQITPGMRFFTAPKVINAG